MDTFLTKTKVARIMRQLRQGDKTWKELETNLDLPPATLSKYLKILENEGKINVIKSIGSKSVKYSAVIKTMIMWDLLDYEEKQALYGHVDPFATSHPEYGLCIDYAALPNGDCYWNMGHIKGISKKGLEGSPRIGGLEMLERAFIETLKEAVRLKKIGIYDANSNNVTLKVKEGKLLVAFQVDWPEFITAYKRRSTKKKL